MKIEKLVNPAQLMQEYKDNNIPIIGINIEPKEKYDDEQNYVGMTTSVNPLYAAVITKEQRKLADSILTNHVYVSDYREERIKQYPTKGEQLDAIYRLFYKMAQEIPAVRQVIIDSDFVKVLKAVKDANPKG